MIFTWKDRTLVLLWHPLLWNCSRTLRPTLITPRSNSAVEMIFTWKDRTHLSVAIQRLYWRHGHNAQVNVCSVLWCFMLILTPFYGFDIISSILIKHCDYWYFFLVWWLLIKGRDPKGATEVPPLLFWYLKKLNLVLYITKQRKVIRKEILFNINFFHFCVYTCL